MSPRARYALSALVVSAALFVVWPVVSIPAVAVVTTVASALRAMVMAPAAAALPDERVSRFLIPALALILCARGLPLVRRVSFAAIAIAVFTVVESFGLAVDIHGIAAEPDAERSLGRLAILMGYVTFQFAFTFGVLIAFVRGDVRSLWELSPAGRFPACPLCGARKTDLAAHVAAAHGESALRDPKVRRLLERRAA